MSAIFILQTAPHSLFVSVLPVTLPQKLRHMATLPHLVVRGDVGIVGKCVKVWGGGRGMRGGVGKCVGKVRRDVGKGEGGSVLGLHTSLHLPHSSPHVLSPCHQYTSPLTPYSFPHFSTAHASFPTSLYPELGTALEFGVLHSAPPLHLEVSSAPPLHFWDLVFRSFNSAPPHRNLNK